MGEEAPLTFTGSFSWVSKDNCKHRGQGLQPLNSMLCLPGPLRCSHSYVTIHTAGTCGLKAAGETGSVNDPLESGMSVSQIFLDMACPSPLYPWQTRHLLQH